MLPAAQALSVRSLVTAVDAVETARLILFMLRD
jgi:hypothetical protein